MGAPRAVSSAGFVSVADRLEISRTAHLMTLRPAAAARFYEANGFAVEQARVR